jgi:copper chaperone
MRNIMKTETLKINGMTCGGCVASVTKVLLAVPGVTTATVSLSANTAQVDFDESQTSVERLKSAVTGSGFGVEEVVATKRGCCG